MKKILFLSYYWPPSGGAGVQRALKFMKYFREFKIDPTLITVDEKVASYPLRDDSLLDDVDKDLKVIKTKSFEPLSWYKRLNKKKEIPYAGFVNINKDKPFQKLSRFIRGNLFIPDARVGWVKYATKAAINALKDDPEVIITTSPPHSSQLAGLKLKKKTGLPWIADLRDPWTDIFYYKDFYHLPFAKRKDANYEREVLENADRIIVTSQATKELYLTKTDKIKADKISVIPNGYDEADFDMPTSFPDKEFVITYSGTIADLYDIDAFLKSLKVLKDEFTDVPIKLRFVGKVSEGIKQKIKENDLLENCEFTGYVSHKEAVAYLLRSSILLIVIPKIENNEGIVPGKIFEYLAAKRPVVCIGPENCNVGEFITECESGSTFDYGNNNVETYLREQILKWKENPSLQIENDKHLKYSRRMLTGKLAQIINEIS
ncbi:MAG: hypothetical protein CL663_01805 [Bacteroidetes bacterium]|nr:hypothetical protein [Bacteroidota bacterium]